MVYCILKGTKTTPSWRVRKNCLTIKYYVSVKRLRLCDVIKLNAAKYFPNLNFNNILQVSQKNLNFNLKKFSTSKILPKGTFGRLGIQTQYHCLNNIEFSEIV